MNLLRYNLEVCDERLPNAFRSMLSNVTKLLPVKVDMQRKPLYNIAKCSSAIAQPDC